MDRARSVSPPIMNVGLGKSRSPRGVPRIGTETRSGGAPSHRLLDTAFIDPVRCETLTLLTIVTIA